jgi:hypothetical protein
MFRMKLGKLANCRDARYFVLPSEHWRRVHTNKPLQRFMREIRRSPRSWRIPRRGARSAGSLQAQTRWRLALVDAVLCSTKGHSPPRSAPVARWLYRPATDCFAPPAEPQRIEVGEINLAGTEDHRLRKSERLWALPPLATSSPRL